MNKKFRKLQALILSLALVIGSIAWPDMAPKASAAGGVSNAVDMTEEEAAVTIWTSASRNAIGHETIQEYSLRDLQVADDTLTYSKVGSSKATVYIHVEKSSPYSRLKVRGGNIATDKFSNKELIGRDNTSFSSKNSPHYIHLGYRTSGGFGSGMGMKESGNYKFTDCNLSNGTDDDTCGIRLTRMTTDIETYIIGIVFSSGQSVSISKDGEITKGFDVEAANVEAWELENSDYSDEELDEMYAEEAESAMEAMDDMYEFGLGNAIAGCEALEEADYSAESWSALQAALEVANAIYEEGYEDPAEDATNADIKAYGNTMKAEFAAARDALMKVRTSLVPVMTTEAGNPKPFRVLSKDEVIAEMGSGINLGNTMDGHSAGDPSETSWQAAMTTKEYITALHDAGYNTVRVPVTWINMIDDENDYAIDEAWMNRVQEIVDYCIELDMYCIINIHHDGAANHSGPGSDAYAWLNTAAVDIDEVYTKFAGTWKSIAERFKNYDEHLIFESMNEVTDDHTTDVHYDTEVLNNLNQIYVNTVRATGSNNTKRWLAITGRFATANEGVTMPADTLEDAGSTTRLMFAVHIYKNMHGVQHAYGTLKDWQSSMSSTFKRVSALSEDMPIYIGEYGTTQQTLSSSPTGYNNIERALVAEAASAIAKFYGACPVVWDQGAGDYKTVSTETGLHSYWNRITCVPSYNNMVEGMIRGQYMDYKDMQVGEIMEAIYLSYGHTSTSDAKAATDVVVTPITDITVAEKLTMNAGERITVEAEVTPAENNDVLLWSSDNDAVATVYNGLVHAKKSGVTTLRAYSQSGDVEKEIALVVAPSGNETAVEITTDKSEYTVEVGKSEAIVTTLTPADSVDEISYRSSNTTVATVNSTGTITAKSPGVAYIIISAASGVTTKVKVTVPSVEQFVDVALHAYYNSGDEAGQAVTIKEDGQYSVSFDVNEDLSDVGVNAGISNLNNVVSIYIKEADPANPVVEAAQIRYDSVVVDGVELTLKSSEFKSALKANGQFDTNDPINGWDGCAVSDNDVIVDSGNHTVTFKNIEDPQKITVTFTIQDLKFFETSEKKNEATEMTTTSDSNLILYAVGDTVEIPLALAPIDTDSFVTAYSSDASIVAVDNTAIAVDENGVVTVKVTAIGEGIATITAMTENGLEKTFTLYVGESNIPATHPPVETQNPNPTAPATQGTATPPAILYTEVPAQAPAKGDVVTAGDVSYVVADAEAKKVEYKAPAKKNVTSVTIPATIELPENGQMVKYQVTGIAKNAFAKNKKLKSVVIGKNVTKIAANAFKDCTSLKKITIKSKKLKSVGKNAIKNINKKAVIKVPKAKLKAYKKLFKKSTGYKKTMKIKKA